MTAPMSHHLQGADAVSDELAGMDQQGGIEYLFPSPILWYVFRNVEALNAELRELILEQERTTRSRAKSNQGGWQSATDFFSWDGSAVATLRAFASRAVEVATARLDLQSNARFELHLSGWAAVNRKGHYNTGHVHPMATWSGIYYVDPGDDDDDDSDAPGGLLELAHPIVASVMTFFPGQLPSARLVRPEAGMIVLFPSYLEHSVRLHRGERPRICVPFNAHLRVVGT